MFMKKKWAFLGGLALASLIAGFSLAAVFNEAGFITGWWGKGSRNNTMQFAITSGASIGAANFVPGVDNTNALGTSALKFSDVQTYDLSVSDHLTVGGLLQLTVSTAPRTANAVAAMTIAPGTVIYNSTDLGLCHSTGSVQSSFVASTAPTTACGH